MGSTNPDLALVDIPTPELDGFYGMSLSSVLTLPILIFTHSHDEHSSDFDANAIAYLLKPIEIERLSDALQSARRLLTLEKDPAEDEEPAPGSTFPGKRLQRIVCRRHSRLLLLDPSEILWFYIDDGTVRAQTASENYWVNYQLNQLEAGLDPELFFRARREVLVNLAQIRSVKPYDGSTFVLVMNDLRETELLVSERRAKDLRSRLPGL